jgi:hypothetical protein
MVNIIMAKFTMAKLKMITPTMSKVIIFLN